MWNENKKKSEHPAECIIRLPALPTDRQAVGRAGRRNGSCARALGKISKKAHLYLIDSK